MKRKHNNDCKDCDCGLVPGAVLTIIMAHESDL